MKKTFPLLFPVLALLAPLAQAAPLVTCYNDDSDNAINQDSPRYPAWSSTQPTFDPADCGEGPLVTGPSGPEYRVLVDGKTAYTDSFDPVVEARVSPAGGVALLTKDGRLLVYRDGALTTWFASHVDPVGAFAFTRAGALAAISRGGSLIWEGRIVRTVHPAQRLFAARSGRLMAWLADGSLVEGATALREGRLDPVVSVKLAADGTVAWLSQRGELGTSRGLLSSHVDRVISFKVSPAGRVAYLTSDGVLYRDGAQLSWRGDRVVQYEIHASGAVAALDSRGDSRYYE